MGLCATKHWQKKKCKSLLCIKVIQDLTRTRNPEHKYFSPKVSGNHFTNGFSVSEKEKEAQILNIITTSFVASFRVIWQIFRQQCQGRVNI